MTFLYFSFLNFHYISSTVGVSQFLQCSACEAHIGLLTDDDQTGELQYYANGVAMTFFPKKKQETATDKIHKTNFVSRDRNQNIPPKLTMEQMVEVVKDLHKPV